MSVGEPREAVWQTGGKICTGDQAVANTWKCSEDQGVKETQGGELAALEGSSISGAE